MVVLKYTLFVDESGEAGIGKVHTDKIAGASPYMTLGAVLIPETRYVDIERAVDRISAQLDKKFLHCNKLKHQQKALYAREMAKQKILCFGIISQKSTLGSYGAEIDGSSARYYNKCAQYLLEKVGKFMKLNNIPADDLSIVFEEGNFNYSGLRALISACRRNPMQPDTKYLNNINPFSISTKCKNGEPLLQPADLVAHALFKCVDKTRTNFQIPEPRYLRELKGAFFHDTKTGLIDNYGIKAVHHLSELSLDDDIHSFLTKLSAK